MLKQQLLKDLKESVEKLGYPSTDSDKIGADIVLSIPQNPAFGDYSTNLALQLSKQNSVNGKQTPTDIAKEIISRLGNLSYLSDLRVEPPGFINFFVNKKILAQDLKEILQKNKDFGKTDKNTGKKARVEFVSANPTGPLHFGNGRGGPLGDSLASVLEFTGYEVLREYLNNDMGNQVKELGKTLAARAGLIKVSEDGLTYKGGYTKELAPKIKESVGDISGLSQDEIIEKAGQLGVKLLHEENLSDTRKMGINYDLVVNESELQKEAAPILADFEAKGILVKKEGAVWFAPKDQFLGDREAVVVKSDGSYTYFVADITYHKQKFTSGFDLVVDIFGSNTAGHVPKLQALAAIFGFDPEHFRVILYQYVRIKRGKEVLKMSKRAGNFVTVREVIEEVGKDALRFMMLMYAPQTHMDFDLELAKQQSNKNPVYYVQYAYARMSNILNKSQKSNADLSLLTQIEEISLIKHLLFFPDLVEGIARDYQVHHLTGYAISLADLFHKFYEKHRVLNAGNEELVQARLALVKAARIVLANTLGLLGVSAPERM